MDDFKCTAGMCIYRERKARFQGVLEKDLASQTTKERVKFEQIPCRKKIGLQIRRYGF